MAQPPDLQAILAALAAQAPANQAQPQAQQQSGQPLGAPLNLQALGLAPPGHAQMPPYGLPQPTNSGHIDLSAVNPVNSGSVNINDAIAKARSFAAEKGIAYDSGRNSADARRGGPYQRSRSRSRSPRRDNYNANPYRDDRRDDARRGGFRDRSRSPARGQRFSPPNGRGYGRDRSPPRRDNDDSDLIEIDSNLVGLVIGRQGENMRRIESETSARIQFITSPDHPGPTRSCRISGPPRAREAAKREIDRTIAENKANQGRDSRGPRNDNRDGGYRPQQPPMMQQQQQSSHGRSPSQQPALREGENAVQIMVPDRTVGLIIGRGGETIRDLQERSECHINIVGPNKSLNGLRPVNLIGTPEASQKAKDLIMEIVESDTRGNSGQTDNAPAQNYAPQTRNNDNHAPPPGKISETIMVPSESVGMIIGKGGETIREMQATSQCKINVSQASGADIEREIGLVGTAQAIAAAKAAVWEKVDMVREKGNQRANNRHDNNGGDRYSQNQQYGGGRNGGNNSYNQQSNGYNQGQQGGSNGADSADTAADPYAAYGGYANYMAMWYAAALQPGQNQPAPTS
ncbi:hypothetical protein BT63DRAFT_456320 [Microthyrium microscopicum]|uniref:K Homology domain-containing protein n=1 Tax=Microthyrium microscopicum TaxID=703497 RepID=A0A6A6UAQ5_9PEZI|nr:hypothetical protein BT63DRAFT_456320 [Microthyrium microscopicum]